MAYDLYVITDRQIARGLSHSGIARLVIEGGADVVQLRDKGLPCRDLFAAACEIRKITREAGVLFIVNDRIDIAIASGAEGVHLGQDDLPLREARRIAPAGFIIGVSVGCVAEAVAAETGGASYVALSPIFPTASKEDAGHGHGIEVLREICSAVALPVIAIGGITRKNAPQVVAAGAEGVAVISSVVGQPDISDAARQMKAIVRNAKARRIASDEKKGPE
ncbi:MAG: thiamine phosphate synthase [Methanoregula sp.]|nr:thiamine phosphate synthase [Methanoregula sp.]